MPEDLQGYKYKGEDIVFLIEAEEGLIRPFDQTGGSLTLEADELDGSTKDRSGTDYGEVTETRSFEGELVYDDPFVDVIKDAMRNKKFVKVYEVNLKTNKAEYGMHMISNFERGYDHGDFATYSVDANLFGDVCETELTEIPDGAPALAGIDCDGEEGGGVEG